LTARRKLQIKGVLFNRVEVEKKFLASWSGVWK